ncbi:hypothetical protein KR018_001564 [Drosophila ironensis]|nr:hypothetical protein KR018_001564 [Drosophila ironensis]
MSSNQDACISFKDKFYIWNTSEDTQDVIDAMDSQALVHTLILEGNTIGVEAAEAIADALKQHPELRKVFLANLFQRRSKTEILLGLQHFGVGFTAAECHLTVLDLSDNNLGTDGFIGLDAILTSPACYSLQELHLENCSLMPHGAGMLAHTLNVLYKNALKANVSLKLRVLKLASNYIEVEGCDQLCETFKMLKTLEVLDFSVNDIFLESAEKLGDALMANNQLQVLNMHDNVLAGRLETITEVLPQLNMLTKIDFGDCLIGTKGATLLGEALTNTAPLLEYLDLGYNHICINGGLKVVQAMKDKPNMIYLYLGGNCFGSNGCNVLIAEMTKYPYSSALGPFDEDDSEEDDYELATTKEIFKPPFQ